MPQQYSTQYTTTHRQVVQLTKLKDAEVHVG